MCETGCFLVFGLDLEGTQRRMGKDVATSCSAGARTRQNIPPVVLIPPGHSNNVDWVNRAPVDKDPGSLGRGVVRKLRTSSILKGHGTAISFPSFVSRLSDNFFLDINSHHRKQAI